MSAIEVKNLVKKFHGQTVLHGIDLEVKPGEVVAIIGPSGSGKTTLLRSINLLEQPEAGTITVGKRYVAGRDNPGAGAVPSGAVDYLAHAGGVHHVPGGFAHLLDYGDCVIDVAEPF